jgi:hypothetical protein
MRAARVADRPAPARRGDLAHLVIGALACAALLAVVMPALRVPPQVDRLTVENPHPWGITVTATGVGRDGTDGWHAIGALERESDQSFLRLMDQGDRWMFRFSYAGEHADLSVTAAQLEEDGWRITVPDRLAADLRAAGIAETPP